MTKVQFYKVITSDLKAANGGTFDYSPYIVGERAGKPLPVEKVELCCSGWHLTSDPMAWPKVGMRVFETNVTLMGPSTATKDREVRDES